MATVYVGSARIDENGKAYGGKAGDQTGNEVSKQKYYVHPKEWRVFRAKDRQVALKIAGAMEAACKNNNIGYDQWQRNSLYQKAAVYGFDPGKVDIPCETDCSALVRVCCAYAGIVDIPADFRTGNMPWYLLATGDFIELKGGKYTDQSTYLGKGDILVTRSSGHTVVVLDDGAKYEEAWGLQPAAAPLGDRLLKHGAEGADVKTLQEYLIGLGYDLGRWGADGDYGDATELAVMRFQREHGLDDDGDYGPLTHAKLMEVIEEEKNTSGADRAVRIENGDCWVRTAPNTDGEKLGVAKKGWTYDYQGVTSENGWHLIEYDGKNGWVSGKYGRVEG